LGLTSTVEVRRLSNSQSPEPENSSRDKSLPKICSRNCLKRNKSVDRNKIKPQMSFNVYKDNAETLNDSKYTIFTIFSHFSKLFLPHTKF
jgi:hypothetical protein